MSDPKTPAPNDFSVPEYGPDAFDWKHRVATISWVQVPFDGAAFDGTIGMQWSVKAGNQAAHQYVLLGRTVLLWQLRVINTQVIAPVSQTLRVRLPGGFRSPRSLAGWGWAADNGVGTSLRILCDNTAGPYVFIQRADRANWTASAAGTVVEVGGLFEVVAL